MRRYDSSTPCGRATDSMSNDNHAITADVIAEAPRHRPRWRQPQLQLPASRTHGGEHFAEKHPNRRHPGVEPRSSDPRPSRTVEHPRCHAHETRRQLAHDAGEYRQEDSAVPPSGDAFASPMAMANENPTAASRNPDEYGPGPRTTEGEKGRGTTCPNGRISAKFRGFHALIVRG